VNSSSVFDIGFIDTRGVDETAIRPDLKARLDDERVLIVLCSLFKGAPDHAMKTFIEHVAATGSVGDFADRLALLILPRPTEAIEMKDDAGEQVEMMRRGMK